MTAGHVSQLPEQLLHRAVADGGADGGLGDHGPAGVQGDDPGAGAAQVHPEGHGLAGHRSVVTLLPKVNAPGVMPRARASATVKCWATTAP